jgi:hypothetical protein
MESDRNDGHKRLVQGVPVLQSTQTPKSAPQAVAKQTQPDAVVSAEVEGRVPVAAADRHEAAVVVG